MSDFIRISGNVDTPVFTVTGTNGASGCVEAVAPSPINLEVNPIGSKGDPGEGADPQFIEDTVDRLEELEGNRLKPEVLIQNIVANTDTTVTSLRKIQAITVFHPATSETTAIIEFETNAAQTEATFQILWAIPNAQIQILTA